MPSRADRTLRALNRCAGASLILLMTAAGLWACSSRWDWRIRFSLHGERYALRSWQGELGMWGAPREAVDDGWAGRVAKGMSETDFNWKPAIERRGGWYVEGDVRPGTPTFEMYQCSGELPRDARGMHAAERAWLRALDGKPNQFIPAHMMLMTAAGRWREVNNYVGTGQPYVYLPSHPGWSVPDLGDREKIRQEWHELCDVQVKGVHYGWIVFGLLVVPFAWATQPRREARSIVRWAFNVTAAASFLLFLAISVFGVRSYRMTERWGFGHGTWGASLRLPTFWSPILFWDDEVAIESSGGALKLEETLDPEARNSDLSSRRGYQRIGVVPPRRHLFLADKYPIYFSREDGWVPGAYYVQRYPTSTRQGHSFRSGHRQFVLSWWIPWLLVSIPCAIWLRSQWRYRKVHQWRKRNHLCLACGYDLRATPDQCPECGARPGDA